MVAMTSTILFGLFGTGGFAREVMPLVKPSLKRQFTIAAGIETCFVDRVASSDSVNGVKVLSEEDFL
jgi:hypothetical protein